VVAFIDADVRIASVTCFVGESEKRARANHP
jgi:hypothetical protein